MRKMKKKEPKERTNSSYPIGPCEVICNILNYLIYNEKHRIVKAKTPPPPPLPPDSGKEEKKNIQQRNYMEFSEELSLELLLLKLPEITVAFTYPAFFFLSSIH